MPVDFYETNEEVRLLDDKVTEYERKIKKFDKSLGLALKERSANYDHDVFQTTTHGVPKDLMRRMYYSSRRLAGEDFKDLTLEAGEIIKTCFETDLILNFDKLNFNRHILTILEDLVLASTFVIRGQSKQNLHFHFPKLAQQQISIASIVGKVQLQNSGKTIMTSGKKIACFIDSPDNDQTLVMDKALSKFLREIALKIDERQMLFFKRQFMLGKHWLSDRFARMSPNDDISYTKLVTNQIETTGFQADEMRQNLKSSARWLTQLFDADFSAIYKLEPNGELDCIVDFARSNENAQYFCDRNRRRMEDLKILPIKNRQDSMSYRTIRDQRQQDVSYWNGRQSEVGMTSDNDMPERNKMLDWFDRPYSAIAAPIFVHGEIWGVIEVVGLVAHQFTRVSQTWLEEACQLIGQTLYQSYLMKHITNASIKILGNTDTNNDEPATLKKENPDPEIAAIRQRNEICEDMANIFIASGAALWVKHPTLPTHYSLRGGYGVGDWFAAGKEQTYLKWPSLRSYDTDSLVIKATGKPRIDKPDKLYWFDPIEPVHSSMDGKRKDYLNCLHKEGFDYVTVIPLMDTTLGLTTPPVGALSLYTKSPSSKPKDSKEETRRPYSRRWLPIMKFAAKHLAMLLKTQALEQRHLTHLEILMSHEVLGKIRKGRDQFNYLQHNFLESALKGKPDETPPRARKVRKDLRKARRRINQVFDSALNQLDSMRSNNFQLNIYDPLAFLSKAPKQTEPVTLFNIVQSAFNGRYQLSNRRRLEWDYVDAGLPKYIRLKCHIEDIEKLIDNLAENALKYAREETTVKVQLEKRPTDSLRIYIRNEGRPLDREEIDQLFDPGFRSHDAWRSGVDGAGAGLFTCYQTAMAMGMALRYEMKNTSIPETVIHSFYIFVPHQLVIYE